MIYALHAPVGDVSTRWLKALLQPMHGWVKWTTEAGKGLFVRNDVLMALLSGVLAHVQGEISALSMFLHSCAKPRSFHLQFAYDTGYNLYWLDV